MRAFAVISGGWSVVRGEFVSKNPGRDVQRVGTARFLGQSPHKVQYPVWGVLGNAGDSQCYLGVQDKVTAIQDELGDRIVRDDLAVRLIRLPSRWACRMDS